jgi:hypothetical protein
VGLEGLGQLKKSNDIIGNRTRDLSACSIVPQLRYRVPQYNTYTRHNLIVSFYFSTFVEKLQKVGERKRKQTNNLKYYFFASHGQADAAVCSAL